jgi:hypothetical protein
MGLYYKWNQITILPSAGTGWIRLNEVLQLLKMSYIKEIKIFAQIACTMLLFML